VSAPDKVGRITFQPVFEVRLRETKMRAPGTSSFREVDSIINARRRAVGAIVVRRLLPSRNRQTIGPFIFLNHMGPSLLDPGEGVDVPPHPHINLATVTYLLAGELIHRDSLGSLQTIVPGDLNWMHAGSGIVHSERSSPSQRAAECRIESIQLWVALPKAKEETPPHFDHYSRAALPEWKEPGIVARVLVGTAFGCKSPVKTSSETLYVDVSMERGACLTVPQVDERCVYVVRGGVSCGGERWANLNCWFLAQDPRPSSRRIALRGC